MAQPVFPSSFRPPPRMTDVALPTDNKYPSKRVIDILEDMDTVTRLQIAALSAPEREQLKTYLGSWIEALEAYGRQGGDAGYRAERSCLCSSRRKSKCASTNCLYWFKSSERT